MKIITELRMGSVKWWLSFVGYQILRLQSSITLKVHKMYENWILNKCEY